MWMVLNESCPYKIDLAMDSKLDSIQRVPDKYHTPNLPHSSNLPPSFIFSCWAVHPVLFSDKCSIYIYVYVGIKTTCIWTDLFTYISIYDCICICAVIELHTCIYMLSAICICPTTPLQMSRMQYKIILLKRSLNRFEFKVVLLLDQLPFQC